MAVIILPGAQDDLLSLQEYMLSTWNELLWLKAEDEIFDKLAKVDTGLLNGTPVQALAAVGIMDYRNVFTSHHKLVYRQVDNDTYLYLAAGHRQDFESLLIRRLLKV